MGTLGCVNDMMSRDKENRRLLRQGRDRMKETRNRLAGIGGKTDLSNVSLEDWEAAQRLIASKEEADAKRLFRLKLLVIILLGIVVLLGAIAYLIFGE